MLCDTAVRRAIAQRLLREQLAEELRVLYVAMTRAQHRLILIGSWRGAQALLERAVTAPAPLEVLACRAPLQWALMGTRAHCPTRVHARETFLRAPQAERGAARHRRAGRGRGRRAGARLAWRYPFADAAALPSKAAVSALVQPPGEAPAFETPAFARAAARPGEPEPLPPDAAERGSAVHAVLASLPLRPLESAALRAHGAALVRDGG